MSDFTRDSDLFWGAIDFLCVPSNADNSPNVIHEAKLLGIPVLATQVGGIPELLDKNFDIELESPEAELDSVVTRMKKNLQLLENPESRRLSISTFHKLVGSALDDHIVLYSEILKSH